MTTHPWTLDLDSEARVLLPWLQSRPSEHVRERALDWIGNLLNDPVGRGVEDRPGLYSALVSGTGVAIAWTLDVENRRVVLLLLGEY